MTGAAAAGDRAPAFAVWMFALLGGLSAWMVRLLVGTVLVRYACTGGLQGWIALWATSAAGMGISGAALAVSWRVRRHADNSDSMGITGVLGTLGLLLNGISLLLIAVESVPIAVIDPCR